MASNRLEPISPRPFLRPILLLDLTRWQLCGDAARAGFLEEYTGDRVLLRWVDLYSDVAGS